MLNETQIECIRLLVKGTTKTDIAKELHINRTTVYDWLKLEEFKAELDKCQQEYLDSAIYKLKRAAPVAADKLLELLSHSTFDKVKLDAAINVLDRTTGKATTKVEVSNDKDSKSVSKDILESEFNEVDDKGKQ